MISPMWWRPAVRSGYGGGPTQDNEILDVIVGDLQVNETSLSSSLRPLESPVAHCSNHALGNQNWPRNSNAVGPNARFQVSRKPVPGCPEPTAGS